MSKSETNTPQTCGKCGAVLSGYAPDGMCAVCLLQSAFENPDTEACETSSSAPLLVFKDYELLEEIARGGMGVVYRARQISLNRMVAIKMILGGHLANSSEMQRFRAEAETAAQLQHPNIVAIHEVGEYLGQPFFSMDLVEGQNLAQFVRDEPMSSRKAAAYLKTIAEAVQYAHSRGVLHRDLKPSNILIDHSDQPRVSDFGLAKRFTSGSQGSADDPHFTQTGQVLGSPSFIPPEQAAGQKDAIGPASDVYSLGAILYHCLTARPPFVAETMTQTLRMVAETEPVSPRLLNASVPRDLETICIKCLEKDPRRRYASAQDLADDLNRFLRDEPLHARAVSQGEKMWRWCRRKPALAAVILLVLVVAIGSPIAAFRINRERLQAEANEKKAQTEASKSQQVARFLGDMLKGIEPEVAKGSDTVLLRKILDKSAERITFDLSDQPEVRAQLEYTIASVYGAIGDHLKGETMHLNALATRRTLLGNWHPTVAESLYLVALNRYDQGRADEAESPSREALAIRRKHFESAPMDVADSLNLVALVIVSQGKLAEAETLTREGLAIKRKHFGNENIAVVKSLTMLGHVLVNQAKPVEAEVVLHEGLAMYRRLAGGEFWVLSHMLYDLANAACQQDRFSDAEGFFREQLRIQKQYASDGHRDTLVAMSGLATTLLRQGQLAEAETLFRESLTIREQKFPVSWHNFITRSELGEVLLRQKKFDEAEPFLISGYEGMEQRMENIGNRNKMLEQAVQRLIQLYDATNRPVQAAEWREKLNAFLQPEDPAPY